MTATLRTSQEAPRAAHADAIIIGVAQGPDGPRLAPGAEDVDAALGGTLSETLAALGATGKAEEVTRIASAGRLTTPLVAAVGLGEPSGGTALDSTALDSTALDSTALDSTALDSTAFDGEALRRAAGAAVRALVAGKARQIALALPARDAAETEAVALGALLGGYVFGRYRDGGKQTNIELTLLGGGDTDAAARRARVLADAVTLVRDLVNTGPSDLFPASFAAEAERVAGAAGLDIEVLDEKALAEGGTAASWAWARARCTRRGWSGWPTPLPARTRPWSWRARASPSTRAGCP